MGLIIGILEGWFKDPIDVPCPYCEAEKEIIIKITEAVDGVENPYKSRADCFPYQTNEPLLYDGFEKGRQAIKKVIKGEK